MTYRFSEITKSNNFKKKENGKRATSVCYMESKMFGIKQTDKIPNSTVRDKIKVDDILKVMTKIKWKWAGHVACMKENRWTVR